jgi:hypothetical protein
MSGGVTFDFSGATILVTGGTSGIGTPSPRDSPTPVPT